MSRSIVFITGSPSATSRSARVARAVAAHLEPLGFSPRFFSINDVDAAEALHGRTTSPAVAALIAAAKEAAGIVLASPTYKATYSGALKVLVDLLPYDGLVGKAALGIATTRVAASGQEVGGAYRALFAFFRARAVDALIVQDDELPDDRIEASAEGRIAAAAQSLARELEGASSRSLAQ